jgi:hypothetical protein
MLADRGAGRSRGAHGRLPLPNREHIAMNIISARNLDNTGRGHQTLI